MVVIYSIMHWPAVSPPILVLVNGYLGYFPGVKWPGREADHSPPSNVEVKNEWSHASSPPVCLNAVDRGIFSIFIFRRVRIVAKIACYRRNIRPSACFSAAPIRRISMKFGIGDFFKNLWRNSRFGYNRATMPDALLEDVCCRCLH
jgi:hypothetical protein